MNKTIELRIEEIDVQGYGLGYYGEPRRPVRLWGATLGDLALVRIVHKSHHRWVGELIELLEPGQRHERNCAHRPKCGGCPQFEADPEALQAWRLQQLEQDFPWLELRAAPAQAPSRWRTRSKWMVEGDGESLRFTVPRPRSVNGMTIPLCPIVPTISAERLRLLKEQLKAPEFASVHALILSEGSEGHEGLAPFGIGLVSGKSLPEERPQVGELGDSVAWLQQGEASAQLFRGAAQHYSGPSCVAVPLGNSILPTPPLAFLQAHPEGRLQLLQQVLDWAGQGSGSSAVDLGSGSGFFARSLAEAGWLVDAVEPSPHAAAAWEHLGDRLCFHPCGAEDFSWPSDLELVVIDPPRSGMKPAWFAPLLAASPRLIITAHCGRAAAKRDLTTLRESGYKPLDACLIDLFPGSPHGELISLWERQ